MRLERWIVMAPAAAAFLLCWGCAGGEGGRVGAHGSDADADSDSDTGTGTGTDADSDSDTDTGTGTDSGTGTGTGTGTGADADSDSDSDTDSGTGTDTGSDSDSGTGGDDPCFGLDGDADSCAEGECCVFGCGGTDPEAACILPDRMCPEIALVCGCDGRTYDSTCAAHADCVGIAHDGACADEPCDYVDPGKDASIGCPAGHVECVIDGGARTLCIPVDQHDSCCVE